MALFSTMSRLRWNSRLVFILAAVGSAVGLGNLWRFPYLSAKHGGGAFLLPYLIALIVIGLPLLMVEFAVGQKLQQGAIGSFRDLHRKFGGLGVFALLSSFIIVSYYAVVMAWSLYYFISSFTVEWAGGAEAFFNQNVLQITDSINQVGGMNWAIFAGLIAVWALIYFAVWKGPKSVEKVVKWTVPLPVILLLVLLIRAVTLPGFLDGWKLFVTPQWSALLNAEVWMAAVSQVFFTLSLAFGIMVAYASYKDEDAQVAEDAWLTALLNTGVSLLAGLTVFGILGFMATQSEATLSSLAESSGPGLAFVVFPQALELLPAPALFSAIFFFILLTLGIDSAFSLVEAVNTGLLDDLTDWRTKDLSFVTVTAALIVGIPFATNAGLYFLDVVDHFVNTFNLVLIGFLESILAGWVYGADKLRSYINETSEWHTGRWFNYAIKYVIPVSLGFLIGKSFLNEIAEFYGGYPAWAISIGWGIVAVPLLYFLYYAFTTSSNTSVET